MSDAIGLSPRLRVTPTRIGAVIPGHAHLRSARVLPRLNVKRGR